MAVRFEYQAFNMAGLRNVRRRLKRRSVGRHELEGRRGPSVTAQEIKILVMAFGRWSFCANSTISDSSSDA